MAESTYLGDAIMQDVFGISSFTVPGTVYAAVHTATTFAAAVSAGDSSIDVNDEVTQGQRLVLEPQQTVAETHYAGTVTDNGDGTFTVSLEDSSGTSTTAANAHDSGDYVKFDPEPGGSDVLEPSSGGYGRVSITNDGTEWSFSSSTVDNDNAITFPQATGAWGLATHALLYDASTGGNLLWISEMGNTKDIVTDDQLEFAAGDMDFSH